MPRNRLNPNPPEFWPAVRRGVQAALDTLPEGAAEVTWDDAEGGVEMTPRTPDAARVAVLLNGGDEVLVQAGRTWFLSFGRADAIETDLRQLLTAIFAGGMESARVGNAARITTENGVVKVGDRSTLPLPWAWRRPEIGRAHV